MWLFHSKLSAEFNELSPSVPDSVSKRKVYIRYQQAKGWYYYSLFRIWAKKEMGYIYFIYLSNLKIKTHKNMLKSLPWYIRRVRGYFIAVTGYPEINTT